MNVTPADPSQRRHLRTIAGARRLLGLAAAVGLCLATSLVAVAAPAASIETERLCGQASCPPVSDFAIEDGSTFFAKLLDTEDFPARWYCGNWSADLGWLHILSDLAIFGAYFAIPVVIFYFLLNKPDLPFTKAIWLFAAFILSCGIGHLIEAGIFWWPAYRLSGLVKAVTAIVSWATVIAMIRLAPAALKLPSAAMLAKQLQASQDRLNFAIHSADIGIWDWDLKTDKLTFDETVHRIFDIDRDTKVDYSLVIQRIHPDDREQVQQLVADSLKTGCDYDTKYRCIQRDGSVRYVRATGRVTIGNDGKPQHFIGVCFDYTKHQRLDEAIVESERNFRSTFENVAQGLAVVGLDGRWLRVNQGLCDIVEYSEAELLDSCLQAITHVDDLERCQQNMANLLSGACESFTTEKRCIRKDGSVTWTNLTASLVRDAQGQAKQFIVVIEDIQSRKDADLELRKQRAQFESFLKSDIVGIAICRSDGTVEQANDEILRILGFSRTELEQENLNLRELTPPEYKALDAQNYQDITRDGSVKPFEKEFYRSDRSRIPVVKGITQIEGQDDHFLCFVLDASSQKETETQLIAAKQIAEQSNQAKSEFLAVMSHELRTPLNGVLGMTELLADTPLNSRQQRYLDACQSSGKCLLTLIDDILDFSKIEAGRLELDEHPFALLELLESVLSSMQLRADEKDIELLYQLEHSSNLQLQGDSHRLRQVLMNLLANALKFTEQGEVCLRATPDRLTKTQATIRFTVSDTGIGIPQDRLHRLFQSFSQVDSSTTRKYGGSGLGLSISKGIVDAMGGSMGVESESGVGSQFWFTVTFQRTDQTEPGRKLLADKLDDLNVLVVEHDDALRRTLVSMLQGWKIRCVAQADSYAVEHVMHHAQRGGRPFDFAIIAHDLPGDDGLQLAQRIRTLPELNNTQLILTMSLDSELSPEHVIFEQCLQTPLSQSRLLQALSPPTGGAPSPSQLPELDEQTIAITQQAKSPELRILLADDHPINQLFAGEILAKADLDFDTANDGREVLEAVRKTVYDVIVMDCQMPDVDGFEATLQIRALEASGQLPGRRAIIALTANAIRGDQERCLAAGMDDYIAKPFHPTELLAAIQRQRLQCDAKSELEHGLVFDEPEAGRGATGKSTGEHESESEPDQQSEQEGQAEKQYEDSTRPIDTRILMERCMGDVAFAENLLQSFASDGPQRLKLIARHTRDNDPQAVGEVAHALKGLAGIMTAGELQELADQVESAGKSGDIDAVRDLLSELTACMDQCIAYVPQATQESRRSHAAGGLV
ncbi:hybrid sensor histidine kinase/response regulator [Roseimaritima ulvae]|uniref:hybrid sensor histidine kinase/response regulator n=1 Tax=Roseimaritima ulvae TaxID=980254 RepID=UPI00143E01D2|nr:PAS domain S-box protein [Roseimaritima ulvae]